MKDLYMIKLGGGSITNTERPRSAKIAEITRLLNEIYEAKKEKDFDVIIGHGSGSYGHVAAKKYGVVDGLTCEESKRGAVITKVAASELNFIVIDCAIKLGIPVFPFFPSSFAVSDNRKLTDGNVENIKQALKSGFIPLVHGDVVVDAKQGIAIASTEEVLRFLAGRLSVKKVILATDVDGVYDKDPRKYADAKLIEKVTPANIDQVVANTNGARKIDVTGGMRGKITILYETVRGTDTVGYIVNALTPGSVKRILTGESGIAHTRVYGV